MRADYPHRIVIQQATIIRDPMGGEAKTWAVVATRWANVQQLTGREFFAAQQAGATAPALIRLRGEGITVVPTMRVIHTHWGATHVYDVTSVANPDGRNRELHLIAEEAVG